MRSGRSVGDRPDRVRQVAACAWCSHSDRRSPAGFTLIELLVVIGIIGILAGLLLPVLARAKEQGRAIKCVSSLKQMGVAMGLYADENEHYPPGRQAGVTQWDLCVGPYLGGKADPLTPEARTQLFMCPSVQVKNNGVQLNYSANPNVCKEIIGSTGPVPAGALPRAADIIVAADAIQYTADGASHAIFWGARGSSGSPIYLDNGNPASAGAPITVGADRDGVYATMDPSGSDFRYRHSHRANCLMADGHVESLAKGQVRDRNVYTRY